MLGSQATQEDLARLRASLGLNEPLPVQYAHWMAHVVRGDLGRSIWMKRPVLPEVLGRLGATLLLPVRRSCSPPSAVSRSACPPPWPRSLLDRFSAVASLFGASMPSFWLGIVLMVVFALWLGWLPASGMFAPYGGGGVGDLLSHLILPAVTLAAASITIIARLTRSTMLETLGQDYVRTARAKGVAEGGVLLRHGLKNALIPIVTVVGVQAASPRRRRAHPDGVAVAGVGT
jgi:peptide/nickel transport system permease protein